MATMTVCKVKFTEHEVEIPDECPECGYDLTGEGSLRGCFLSDQIFTGRVETIRGGFKVVALDTAGDHGDQYDCIGVECRRCEHAFGPTGGVMYVGERVDASREG